MLLGLTFALCAEERAGHCLGRREGKLLHCHSWRRLRLLIDNLKKDERERETARHVRPAKMYKRSIPKIVHSWAGKGIQTGQ